MVGVWILVSLTNEWTCGLIWTNPSHERILLECVRKTNIFSLQLNTTTWWFIRLIKRRGKSKFSNIRSQFRTLHFTINWITNKIHVNIQKVQPATWFTKYTSITDSSRHSFRKCEETLSQLGESMLKYDGNSRLSTFPSYLCKPSISSIEKEVWWYQACVFQIYHLKFFKQHWWQSWLKDDNWPPWSNIASPFRGICTQWLCRTDESSFDLSIRKKYPLPTDGVFYTLSGVILSKSWTIKALLLLLVRAMLTPWAMMKMDKGVIFQYFNFLITWGIQWFIVAAFGFIVKLIIHIRGILTNSAQDILGNHFFWCLWIIDTTRSILHISQTWWSITDWQIPIWDMIRLNRTWLYIQQLNFVVHPLSMMWDMWDKWYIPKLKQHAKLILGRYLLRCTNSFTLLPFVTSSTSHCGW